MNKYTKEFDFEGFDVIDKVFRSKDFFQDLEYTINYIFKNIDKNTFQTISSNDVLNSFKEILFGDSEDILSVYIIETFLAKTDFLSCFFKIFWYKYWNELSSIVIYISSLLISSRVLNTIK